MEWEKRTCREQEIEKKWKNAGWKYVSEGRGKESEEEEGMIICGH